LTQFNSTEISARPKQEGEPLEACLAPQDMCIAVAAVAAGEQIVCSFCASFLVGVLLRAKPAALNYYQSQFSGI
jgi:hypothetical protein